MNQMSVKHKVGFTPIGDFSVDDIHLFEIGDKRKTFEQVKNEPNSYVAADDMEIGMGNKIPLWLLGMTY